MDTIWTTFQPYTIRTRSSFILWLRRTACASVPAIATTECPRLFHCSNVEATNCFVLNDQDRRERSRRIPPHNLGTSRAWLYPSIDASPDVFVHRGLQRLQALQFPNRLEKLAINKGGCSQPAIAAIHVSRVIHARLNFDCDCGFTSHPKVIWNTGLLLGDHPHVRAGAVGQQPSTARSACPECTH
jgi:hypothetical protein